MPACEPIRLGGPVRGSAVRGEQHAQESLAAENLFGDGHGGHGLGPAGVEGQVRDRLDEFASAAPFCLARPRW